MISNCIATLSSNWLNFFRPICGAWRCWMSCQCSIMCYWVYSPIFSFFSTHNGVDFRLVLPLPGMDKLGKSTNSHRFTTLQPAILQVIYAWSYQPVFNGCIGDLYPFFSFWYELVAAWAWIIFHRFLRHGRILPGKKGYWKCSKNEMFVHHKKVIGDFGLRIPGGF